MIRGKKPSTETRRHGEKPGLTEGIMEHGSRKQEQVWSAAALGCVF
jgi:hypothetical protein